MGGVAGEAGLYSTASDLAKIYQMYLNKGTLDGKRYLKESTCTLFETRQSKISHRGLGFDRPKVKKSAQGSTDQVIPASSFGHVVDHLYGQCLCPVQKREIPGLGR